MKEPDKGFWSWYLSIFKVVVLLKWLKVTDSLYEYILGLLILGGPFSSTINIPNPLVATPSPTNGFYHHSPQHLEMEQRMGQGRGCTGGPK